MSVIVRGIDPPTDCRLCPYLHYLPRTGRTECIITHTILAWDYKPLRVGVATDCPIEAVDD
jgi:hypothetical protein